MNKANKIVLIIGLIAIMLFGSSLLFNHVYAWLGILGYIITFIVAMNIVIKEINKVNKNTNTNK